jgi:formate hydrogenlyase subunit 3/multisubunit Na+/H+ antiporter MnhD subunit
LLSARNSRAGGWFGIAIAGLAILTSLRFLLTRVWGTIEFGEIWIEEVLIYLTMRLDTFSELMIFIIGIVALSASLASHYRNGGREIPVILLAAGAASGGVLADDLASLYVFSALLSIIVCLSLAQLGQGRVAVQMFATIEGTAALFLAAGVLVAATTSSIQTDIYRQSTGLNSLSGQDWIFLPLLGGVLARCGLFPFYSWLTRASGKLSPANAAWILVLPIVLGLSTLCRHWVWIYRLDPPLMLDVLAIVSAITVVGASYAALHTNTTKQMAVWLSISLAGYVPLSLAVFYEVSINAAVGSLVVFGLIAPLLHLMAGRLSDLRRQDTPQDPISIWLALFPLAVTTAFPVTIIFTSRFLLAQALVDRPVASGSLLVSFIAGSAFTTLAAMSVIERLRRTGLVSADIQWDTQKLLSGPYTAAMLAPISVIILIGILPSFVLDLVSDAATRVLVDTASFYIPSLRGTFLAVLMVFIGPVLGFWLYDLNQDSPNWRWKVLGVQQLEGRNEEAWWKVLRRLDPYAVARLSILGVSRIAALVVDGVSAILCR